MYYAWQSPRTPFLAKLILIVVISYALSSIDVMPDFMPVLGYLDDLVLLPLGISFAVKWIPSDLWNECQSKAGESIPHNKGLAGLASSTIVIIWLALTALVIRFLLAYRANK